MNFDQVSIDTSSYIHILHIRQFDVKEQVDKFQSFVIFIIYAFLQ